MVVASVGDHLIVKTAQGVRIEGELPMKDIPESEHFDVIIVPGGKRLLPRSDKESSRNAADRTPLSVG